MVVVVVEALVVVMSALRTRSSRDDDDDDDGGGGDGDGDEETGAVPVERVRSYDPSLTTYASSFYSCIPVHLTSAPTQHTTATGYRSSRRTTATASD